MALSELNSGQHAGTVPACCPPLSGFTLCAAEAPTIPWMFPTFEENYGCKSDLTNMKAQTKSSPFAHDRAAVREAVASGKIRISMRRSASDAGGSSVVAGAPNA